MHVQVAETSVTVNNSAIQDCTHPNERVPPTYDMTPGIQTIYFVIITYIPLFNNFSPKTGSFKYVMLHFTKNVWAH